MAAAVLVGVICSLPPLREWWANRSYDILLQLRPAIDVARDPVLIVDLDFESERALGGTPWQSWDRRLHTALLHRLQEHGARVVAFDLLFRSSGETTKPEDKELLGGIRDHGAVVFGAVPQEKLGPDGTVIGLALERSFPDVLPLATAGVIEHAYGADRVIRQPAGEWRRPPGPVPSLAWRVAELTMADLPGGPSTNRWVNYYGRPFATIQHVRYLQVLSNTLPSTITFSNKVVFVGARARVGPPGGSGADYVPTPLGEFAGVEVNATTYLNLWRGDWLWRGSRVEEILALVLFGLGAGIVVTRRSPGVGAGLVLVAILGIGALSIGFVWFQQFWFPWLIPAATQLPAAWLAGLAIRPVAVTSQRAEAPTTPAAPQAAVATAPSGHPGAATGPATPVPAIPDHTVLRCIGRGAYGQVWLARNAIGTYHAVKVIYRSTFPSEAPFEREFHGIQRFTPISRHHPGWVHILHVGRNDLEGYFFYIMEVADDETTGQEIDPPGYRARSLAGDLARQRRLPFDDCVHLGIALADALDYLHSQLLVHRDIKPSNVIYVHGEPKFADIGTVTEMENRRRAVSWIGTEGYIAPEGPGSAVADLYSLGKLLYEVWTGCDRQEYPRLPGTLLQTTQAVASAEARWAAILKKLCHEDPAGRLPSAAAVRDAFREVQRELAGRS